jgi:hypothetical protein
MKFPKIAENFLLNEENYSEILTNSISRKLKEISKGYILFLIFKDYIISEYH